MTLDDTIKHCQQVADESDCDCADEHRQLAEWLQELKKIKQKQNNEEWIKQCTTEQLADVLLEHFEWGLSINAEYCFTEKYVEQNREHILEWLKQPHKDGEL